MHVDVDSPCQHFPLSTSSISHVDISIFKASTSLFLWGTCQQTDQVWAVEKNVMCGIAQLKSAYVALKTPPHGAFKRACNTMFFMMSKKNIAFFVVFFVISGIMEDIKNNGV